MSWLPVRVRISTLVPGGVVASQWIRPKVTSPGNSIRLDASSTSAGTPSANSISSLKRDQKRSERFSVSPMKLAKVSRSRKRTLRTGSCTSLR